MCQELRRARVMDERENKKQTWRAWLVVAGNARGPRRGPVIVTRNHRSDVCGANFMQCKGQLRSQRDGSSQKYAFNITFTHLQQQT